MHAIKRQLAGAFRLGRSKMSVNAKAKGLGNSFTDIRDVKRNRLDREREIRKQIELS